MSEELLTAPVTPTNPQTPLGSVGGEGVTEPVKIPSLFPEVTILRLCSANVCANGHEFIPTVTLAKCGYGTPQGWNGCGAPILMVKQTSCPVCNEPVVKMRFRTDHTPPTQFASPLCIPGSITHAEVMEINLIRNPKKIEDDYDNTHPTPTEPVASETKENN